MVGADLLAGRDQGSSKNFSPVISSTLLVLEPSMNPLQSDGRCVFLLHSASNILLGDGLVLLSASLYAVSNVCQEYTVKNLSRVEFLGMVGLFGTIISSVQM